MILNIELPDELAAELKKHADAEGLSADRYVRLVLKNALTPAEESGTKKPLKTGFGMWAKYGPAPSAEEIDENRREMFARFAEG